jgi:hypothetical protein
VKRSKQEIGGGRGRSSSSSTTRPNRSDPIPSHRDSDSEIPVPAGHLEIAKARLEDHRRNPEQVRPAREIIDRLLARKR